MKRILVSLCVPVLAFGIAGAQEVQSQASGSATQDATVSAGQTGAHATSNTSATASQAATVSDKDNHAQVTSASQLQAGSTLQAQLTKPLDARKNKVGNEVIAKTTSDVKSNGRVVVPKGSKLVGHVTQVQAHGKGQANSELGIAFDRAVLKNGTEMPLMLSIQAIGRAQGNAAADNDMMADTGMMGSSGARGSGGGGLARGVGSTAGSVVNTAGSAAGSATNVAGSAAGSLPSTTQASGALTASSQGVVGLHGLSLSADASNSTHGSVITSNGGNVHLDSGTEMVLRVNQ
jgi:hypothetical protein